jgi:murein DD-endopeptidase MepM/ murein hydrolase activator NlpD
MVIIRGVRTFGVLLAGWVLGGAILVLMAKPWTANAFADERARTAAEAAASDPGFSQRGETRVTAGPGASTAAPPQGVLIPVSGVTPRELRDTFHEARGGGRTHHAMDILAPRGTPVVAAVDGTIRKLFTSKGGGLTIYQYDRSGQRLYYYAHLDAYAPGLAEGTFLPRGSVIGYVGTTGNAPPGTPHLHFSIEDLPPTGEWWKGRPLNPYPVLMENAGTLE